MLTALDILVKMKDYSSKAIIHRPPLSSRLLQKRTRIHRFDLLFQSRITFGVWHHLWWWGSLKFWIICPPTSLQGVTSKTSTFWGSVDRVQAEDTLNTPCRWLFHTQIWGVHPNFHEEDIITSMSCQRTSPLQKSMELLSSGPPYCDGWQMNTSVFDYMYGHCSHMLKCWRCN